LRGGAAGTEAKRQRQSDHDAFHGLDFSLSKVVIATGRLAFPERQASIRA
jgi:hypothetical protein